MEAWCMSRVVGASVPVLLLALQGLLAAGTPGNNSTDAVTAGWGSSEPATGEPSQAEQNQTSALYPSESLSPSQRSVLLSLPAEAHTEAGGLGTEQTQPYTEVSTRSLDARVLSTEPLTPAAGGTTEVGSRNQDLVSTELGSDSPLTQTQTDTDRPPRDRPSTSLTQGDASPSTAHADVHTNSTFSSTTVSRAGERTLLSVTSPSGNSSSPAFTEDTMSRRPPSTWGVSAASETEGYTPGVTSSRTDATHRNGTSEGTISETGSTGTQSLNTRPNATRHQHSSTSGDMSDPTAPLSPRETSTSQPEPAWASSAAVTSRTDAWTDVSGTDREAPSGSSTESSIGTHVSSTQKPQATETVSSQTSEQTAGWGTTPGQATVSSLTPGQRPVTDGPGVTEVVHTTAPATERFFTTEENTSKAGASTPAAITVTAPPSATSPSWPGDAVTSSTAEPLPRTTVHLLRTVPSSPAPSSPSTPAPQTSDAAQTPSPSPGPSSPPVPAEGPTRHSVTAPPTETSTSAPEITTAARGPATTVAAATASTSTHISSATTTESTEAAPTTRRQTDAATTEPAATSSPSRSTEAPPQRNPCASNPCANGGMCVSDSGRQSACRCQPAWTGPTCSQDVDECETDPCPVGSSCVNTRGSFDCECPLGFDLEDGRTCARAKTFLGTFSANRLPHGRAAIRSSTMHDTQREVLQLLNASLSVLRGYSRSLLRKKEGEGIHILAVSMFSLSADVTSAEVFSSVQMSLSNCSSSVSHCRMVLLHQLTYRMESLCVAQKTQCDTERSTCSDISGTARCQCLRGYYKHNPDDLACLECGDGYKLENGTCVPCMFGFGGFNCGNFYKLIAVVVSPAGGALLLVLVVALAVTCRKKKKNDLNKIIFKSGDLQMSPYADFPKTNRTSMEWGRETIEMQENGSTKNLLQMSDIYYSPVLRNSDLERNGLYQFTGLPGSRHSCIYPAQWNPSFISDDSRRRDYF